MQSCFLALDLKKKGPGIVLKVYLHIYRKASFLEKSPATVLFEALRLDGKGEERVWPALERLEEFIRGKDGGYEGMSVFDYSCVLGDT